MVNDGPRVVFTEGDAGAGQDTLGSLPGLVQVFIRQAGYLAERIEKAAGPNLKEQINQACRIVFNRPPNEEEMEISESLLEEENLFVLCRSLINSNEFFYFD